MARLLLLAIASLGIAASLAFLGFEGLSAGQGWVSHALDPLAASSFRTALIVATIVTAVSVPLGLLFALGLRGGGAVPRAGVLACCALLLLVPRLGISSLPGMAGDEDSLLDIICLTCAVAQATSVVTLFLAVSGDPVPARLIAAARAAGARRLQALRHAVLAPLAWPLLCAAVAAFVIGLRDGPPDFARAELASPNEFPIVDFWAVVAALLLALASLSALAALLRRRRA